MKKQIVFYGDSNTWGYDPTDGSRYPYEKRWVTVCAKSLGEKFNCIPEGMNGRTTIFDDPFKGCRNGLDGLDYILQTHKPVDIFVIMLGTNDLKYTDAAGSASGMMKLIQKIKTVNERFSDSYPVFLGAPEILLISPVEVTGSLDESALFDEKAESKKLAAYYRSVAEKENLHFMDAAEVTQPSLMDGVHLDPEGHYQLGLAVGEKIRELMKAIEK